MVGRGYPPALLQGLLLDLRTGSFGDLQDLEASDFRATANKSGAGPFHFSSTDNTYTVSLTNDLFPYINRTGLTQIRMRFKQSSNLDNADNYFSFYSGDYLTDPSLQPALVVTYYFPDDYQDAIPPATINDLFITGGTEQGSLNLTWTAPGDDDITGTAANYLVRFSSNPIVTEGDWNSATVVSAGVPTPQIAGSPEQMTITDLTPGATYYVVVRAEDEVQNLGGLPGTPVSGIATPDTTAPAQIDDLLAVTGATNGSVDLSWTSPGDDGTSGTAAAYLIRYSGNSITDETTWNGATTVSGVPVPQVAGTPQNMTITGLTPGATYHFVIRAQDEVPNLGPLSNDAQVTAYQDVTPPAQINLGAVTGVDNGTVDLSWTSPGDDGSSGTAAAYLIRYSSSAITDETAWNAATTVSGVPVPAAAGTPQNMIVSGLTPGATYHFVIRAQDEVPNLGPLSNDALVSAYQDVMPPASIQNLSAIPGLYEGTIDLAWTSPGDDGSTGTAQSYYLRYSTSIIDSEAAWDSATVVSSGVPTPLAAGSSQNMTVDGLVSGTNYYFAIRAEDESLNLGPLSNSPNTAASTDSVPPAAITNLFATSGTEEGSVDLSWTAPGDNGNSGTANYYLVRYSTTPITDETAWANATGVLTGIPTPQAAGSTEQMTIEGLTSGATYYFAVKAQDEVINTSALSNSPAGIAKADSFAPAAITDLAVSTGSTTGTVDLNWTSPGDNGNTGTATSYLVRYSTSLINSEAAWNSATVVSSGIPTPVVAGITQNMTVTGLTSGTTYYFAIRARDEVPNIAALSNSPNAIAMGSATTAPCSITTNTTWGPWNNPYTVASCDLTINAGVTLTILPGTIIKFDASRGITISTTGTLNAVGTSGSPILFSANTGTPTAGYWKGINFGSTSQNSVLDYVTVEYGGGGNGNVRTTGATIQVKHSTIRYSSNYGVYATGIANITVSDNNFDSNITYPIYLSFTNGTFTSISGNTLASNGKNGIALLGTMSGNTTLPNIATYIIPGNLTVNTGTTLTIPESVVVKFEGTSAGMTANGTLSAQGSSGNEIYFTSYKDDSIGGDTNNDGIASLPAAGDWTTIKVATTGLASFDYSEIHYGGGTGDSASGNVYLIANGTVNLNHSVVGNSNDAGIKFFSGTGTTGTLTINNSLIEDNQEEGIYGYYSAGTLILNISASIIRNNGSHGVYLLDLPNSTSITSSNLSGNAGSGVFIDSSTSIDLSNNTFAGNTGYAAYLSFTSGTITSLANNSGTGNGMNGIALAGTLGTNAPLPVNPSLPYIIPGTDFQINSGVTLTLPAGIIVKGYGGEWRVNGTLDINGTVSEPVYFTSIKDDSVGGDTNNDGTASTAAAGDWAYIYINTTGVANFDYSEIHFGGGTGLGPSGNLYLWRNAKAVLNHTIVGDSSFAGIYYSPGGVGTTGNLTIINSTIENNQQEGIYSPSVSGNLILNISASTIRTNGANGVYLKWQNATTITGSEIYENNIGISISSSNNSVITGNDIHDNREYGIYISSAIDIDLSNNNFGGNTDYAAYLNLTNGTIASLSGNSGSETGKNGIAITGTIGTNMSLPTDAGMPYIIPSGNWLAISSGVTLTIPAGIVVKGDSGGYWNVHGALDVNGTASQPVYFTSINDDSVGGDTNNDGTANAPAAGDWNYITVTTTGTATIDYSEMHYGGVSDFMSGGNLRLFGNASVFIDHSVLADAYSGIFYSPSSSSVGQLTISDSIVEDNLGRGGIFSGTNAGDLILSISNSIIRNNKTGGVYLETPTISSPTNITGSEIYGNLGPGIRIRCPSTCNISGNNIHDNTRISEFENSGYGAYILNANGINFSDNTFNGNTNYAVYVQLNGTFASFSGNSASGDGMNGFVLTGGLRSDANLPVNSGLPYIITNGDFQIDSGVTLTLPAGIIVKGNSFGDWNVFGALVINGTEGEPVYFTSIKDDSVGGDTNNDGTGSSPAAGDWNTISIFGTATFDYGVIRYAGNSASDLGTLQLFYSGSAVLNHSIVENSKDTGIYYRGQAGSVGNLSINDSTIEDNLQQGIYRNSLGDLILNISNSTIRNNYQGIYLQGPTATNITGSSIYGNTERGILNVYALTPVTAVNNWWGSGTGPAPYGSGNGINYRTYSCGVPVHTCYDYNYYVDATPWVGQASGNSQTLGWNAYVVDPVNTANGNYAYEHTDLSIPTRSFPLAFSRAYNSASPANGPLGYGWTFSYNMYITESGVDRSATVMYGDGRSVRFSWDGTDYVAPAGTFSTLTKSGGLFTLVEKDQTEYAFNASNKLTTITDKNGNVTTLSYTGSNLTAVTAPDGRQLTFSYDGSNRLSGVSDPLSRTLGFIYDGNGDLVTFTDVTAQATTYTYDANHRLLTITDANSHTFLTNVYDADGRVSEQRDAENNLTTFIYDIENHITTVTDPRSEATIYEYDADLRLIQVTDPLSNSESYGWNSNNNRTFFQDKRGNNWAYTYDGRGNLLSMTDPLTGLTTYTYDTENNLLTETDALTNTTTYDYDVSGNLITQTNELSGVTSYSYYFDTPRKGLVETLTDPRLKTTTFDYDAYGNLDSITDPLTHTTTRSFDLGGRMLTESDPLTHTTTYTYDNANRVLTMTDAETGVVTNTYDDVGNLLTTEDPLGHTTTRTYTDKDQLLTVTDAESYVTTYDYDTVGNLTSITDGNNHTTTYAYDGANNMIGMTDPLSHTTTYTYDENGNRTGITDPLSHTTTTTYDDLNRPTVVTDALSHAATTAYDAVGNVISITDARNNTTTYGYDDLYRLTSVTDDLSGVVSYTYDAVGNRLSMEDANNHTTNYTYDDLNRLLTEADPLSNTWTYIYDAAGRRISREDANGVITTYSYDDANRLTGISAPSISITYNYDLAGNRTSLVDASGTTTYAYDDINRPLSIVQPNGTLFYGYDAINRTSVTLPGARTITYVYDAADRLTTVTDWNTQVTTYTYDNANRLSTTAYPNGVVTTNSYDNADRLTGISTVKSPTTILSITYSLDNVGNRLTMVDGSGTTTYTYDDLNRLLSVDYPSGSPDTVSYTYDAMGNRLTLTEDAVTTTYVYDDADRLTSTSGGSALSFTWDDNGQMLSKGSQTFTWDALGRMTGLTNGGTTASYTYNGDGVRIERTVDATSTTYLQDLASGLPVVLSETTGASTSRYVYGADLIALVEATTSYYHADGLGSTRAITDASGAATDQFTYDAFGAPRTHTGSSTTSFTYAGEQADPEAGLVFLRARYYDPTIGRFLSRDPFPKFLASTQAISFYVYVNNNPIGLIDPTGLSSWDLLDANKNGINALVAKVARNIPFVGHFMALNEEGDKYIEATRQEQDFIFDPNATAEDFARVQQARQESLYGMLHETKEVIRTAPCTSMNLDCGLSEFLPQPVQSIHNFFKNPLVFLTKMFFDKSVMEPAWDIPDMLLQRQFGMNDYLKGFAYGGGGGGSWGTTPSEAK